MSCLPARIGSCLQANDQISRGRLAGQATAAMRIPTHDLWRSVFIMTPIVRRVRLSAGVFMLLRGLTWLVLFQLLGTALNHLFLSILPGPIIGLVLLMAYLMWRGEVSEPISMAASSLLRYLPLLLVPPAVGVMVYASAIAEDFWAIFGTLTLSLMISMVFVGWLMQTLIRRQAQRRESP
ncbi:LrgA family protein [Pseudomonas syringae pv. atrofaciens]|nr:LrgA family protein [Pseudomonas syringae pv. atrofaciens]